MTQQDTIVGLDASRAVSTAPTGTEAYSFHLLRHLVPLLSEHHRVRLYLRAAPSETLVQEAENAPLAHAEARVIPFPRLWTHVRLSWEMATRTPDLLFVPAHVLPPVRPRRTLVTVHDLGYRSFPEAHPLRQRLYLAASTRWNVRVATHVLADSEATRDALVEGYRVSQAKISVVYPGYDAGLAPEENPERRIVVRRRYGIPTTGEYLLFIGRIQPRKNLERLVEAFGMIASAYPDLHLVLAGPTGWLSAPITTRAEALGLDRRVSFPGYIDDPDKAALISGARAFAYPSLYEGFGFPVLEAQACGTPLLTSATSSLPEVTGDGGLLVDPEDTAAIAAGLRRLLDDEGLRRHLVEQGFANLGRFSWRTAADQVHAIIERLLTHRELSS